METNGLFSRLGLGESTQAPTRNPSQTMASLGVVVPESPQDREVDLDEEKLRAIRSGDYKKVEGIDIISQIDRSIKDAYANGDPELAEFLEGQKAAGVENQGLGDNLKELGFDLQRKADRLIDRFTGKSKQTALSEEVPEILEFKRSGVVPTDDSEAKAPPLSAWMDIDAMHSSANSDEELAKMYKSRSDVLSVYKDSKDNTYVLFDNGFTGAINKPGVTAAGFEDSVRKAALFALTSGRGTIPAQMLKAMGTQAGLEGMSAAYGGDFSKADIVLSGIMEGAGAGLARSIGKWYSKANPVQRAKVKDWSDLKGKIPNDQFQKLKSLKEATKTLDAPDVTGAQFVAQGRGGEAERAISEFSQSVKSVEDAVRFSDRTSSQDLFAIKEVKKQLEAIPAGKDAIGDGVTKMKKASSNVMDMLKQQRDDVAKKTFGPAMRENAQVDIRSVRELITKKLRGGVVNDGDEQKALMRAFNHLRHPVSKANVTSAPARDAQSVKFQIDSMINGTSEASSGRAARKSLIEVRDQLVNKIDEVSPGYKNANKLYAVGTEKMDEIQRTLIGVIEGTAESRLDNVVNLFDKKDLSSIKALKGLIDTQDKSAFPALYKGWISAKIERLNLRESANPSLDIFNALFAKPNTAKRVFTFAPSPDAKANLRALKDYLRYSKQLRVKSTQAESTLGQKGAEAIRQTSVQGPQATAARGLGGFFERRKADKLMDAILNPKWAEQMKYVRSLNGKKQAQALDDLVNAISATSQEASVGGIMDEINPSE